MSTNFYDLLRTGTPERLQQFLQSLDNQERNSVVNTPLDPSPSSPSPSPSSSLIYPLHYTCIAGDDDKTKLLLSFGSCATTRSSDSFNALHYASASGFGDCVETIIFDEKSPYFLDEKLLEIETNDHCVYLGGIAVYMTGGQNIFHLASYSSNVEFFEIFEDNFQKLKKSLSDLSSSPSLLQEKIENFEKCVNILKKKKDFDENSPSQLAILGHCRSVFGFFDEKVDNLGNDEIQELKSASVRRRNARFAARKKREENEKKRHIFDNFSPLHPKLFALSHKAIRDSRKWREERGETEGPKKQWKTREKEGEREEEEEEEEEEKGTKNLDRFLFSPQLLPLLHSIRSVYRSFFFSPSPPSPPPSPVWASLLSLSQAHQPSPGLFLFPLFFLPSTTSLFVEELLHYYSLSLPFSRPSLSIPFGVVLNSVAVFDELLEWLQQEVVLPLSWFFYSPLSPLHKAFPPLSPPSQFFVLEQQQQRGGGGIASLKEQYTFVKHYIYQQDTDPSTHFDPSVITFSACLGKDFEGSKIYFHGLEGENKEEKEDDGDSSSCPLRVPHPGPCDECVATITHKPGQVVLHRGKHIHGVYRLERGERWNMIMWCR